MQITEHCSTLNERLLLSPTDLPARPVQHDGLGGIVLPQPVDLGPRSAAAALPRGSSIGHGHHQRQGHKGRASGEATETRGAARPVSGV